MVMPVFPRTRRYEGRIVQRLIQADGGKGDYKEVAPPMLGIWNTLLAGEAQATWVFMGCVDARPPRDSVMA